MSKEEPAWKAELREELRIALGASNIENIYVRRRAHDAVFPSMVSHITAAEQRGFQAGVNKTGDSVGKLREQLKTARAAHVEALKTDWSRYRGKVLHEVWEAMRDAEDGPLIDAMGVVNDLLAQS